MALEGSTTPLRRARQHSLRLVPPVAENIKPSKTLWLCIYLPKLAIEAVCCELSSPSVVIEETANRILIYSANESAEARGIVLSHSLSSALALVADLCIYQRHQKKEQQLLNQLAAFAYAKLSNSISLDYKNSLLIEVGRSRQLWQRLEDIKQAGSVATSVLILWHRCQKSPRLRVPKKVPLGCDN